MPHIELLRNALLILNNVTRKAHLVGVTGPVGGADPTSAVETLVDLVQNFRDKEAIFGLAVGLLSRLCKRNSDARAAVSCPEVKRRITGVLAILERKNKLGRSSSANASVAKKLSAQAETGKQLAAILKMEAQ